MNLRIEGIRNELGQAGRLCALRGREW
uniref:Uncharacterized protein n=1 Tax=Arundo donax TaxID=35708 RepID=A0A0A9H6C6_ARUDO